MGKKHAHNPVPILGYPSPHCHGREAAIFQCRETENERRALLPTSFFLLCLNCSRHLGMTTPGEADPEKKHDPLQTLLLLYRAGREDAGGRGEAKLLGGRGLHHSRSWGSSPCPDGGRGMCPHLSPPLFFCMSGLGGQSPGTAVVPQKEKMEIVRPLHCLIDALCVCEG